MTEPHAQDERTWTGHSVDDSVAAPAPANQWTPHDGGIEPAPPAPTSSATALRRFVAWAAPDPASLLGASFDRRAERLRSAWAGRAPGIPLEPPPRMPGEPMPQGAWSDKRERQYEHIKDGLREAGRDEDTAEEIAARTVNKERARAGEAQGVEPHVDRRHLVGPAGRPAVAPRSRWAHPRPALQRGPRRRIKAGRR